MGLFRRRKSRATRRAEAKALKAKAKLEARLSAKNEARRIKADAKRQDKTVKANLRAQKDSDRAALKVAETQLRAAREGKLLSASRIRRTLTISRMLAPVVVPIAYRVAISARGFVDERRADRLGVPLSQLGQFSGAGGALSARIAGAEQTLAQVAAKKPKDAETKQFVSAVTDRLQRPVRGSDGRREHADRPAPGGARRHQRPTRRRRRRSIGASGSGLIDAVRRAPLSPAARLRGMAVGALTAALAVAAHGAGGGGLPSGSAVALLALVSLTLGALVTTLGDTADVGLLVAALAVGQLLNHVLLGAAGHSHPPATDAPLGPMLAAHVVAIALGAALITAGERLCAALSRALIRVMRAPRRPVAAQEAITVASTDQPRQSTRLLSASLSHRGPPVSLAR